MSLALSILKEKCGIVIRCVSSGNDCLLFKLIYNAIILQLLQNHYNDYDWNELQEDGLDVPYITLGWTKESWEGKAPEPASENKTWSNLTLVEQQAADEVCYFLETWDQISMVNWTTDTTTMATPVSTIAPPATTVAIGTTSDSGAPTSVDSSTVRATTTLPV